MISNANVDRYTYFLRPEEINDMVKFDVSGIGLNLVFKEEFNRRAFQVRAMLLSTGPSPCPPRRIRVLVMLR